MFEFWRAWSFVWGSKPTKAPSGDGTGVATGHTTCSPRWWNTLKQGRPLNRCSCIWPRVMAVGQVVYFSQISLRTRIVKGLKISLLANNYLVWMNNEIPLIIIIERYQTCWVLMLSVISVRHHVYLCATTSHVYLCATTSHVYLWATTSHVYLCATTSHSIWIEFSCN